MTLTVQAGEVSQPQFVAAGSLVTIAPSNGATAKVEYTTDGGPAVQNGVAVWQSWPRGVVSAAYSDIVNDPSYLRVTGSGGAVSVEIDATPSAAALAALRADWGAPVAFSRDASGNVTGLVGPGGAVLPIGRQIPSLIVAGLGSSSVDNNSSVSGRVAATSTSGFITWASTLSHGAIWMPPSHDFGLSGDLTAGILGRVDAVLAASPRPDLCIIHAITNDIAAGIPFPTYTANFAAIVDRLLGGGVTPVVMIPQPCRGDTAAIHAGYARAHEWMRATYGKKSGVILVDAIDELIDPAATTYEALAGVMADNRHLNTKGAFLMGRRLAAQLAASGVVQRSVSLRSNGDLYDATNNPTGNLIENGMMLGSSAAVVTGGVAAGHVATGWLTAAAMNGATVTPSKVVDSAGKEWQQFAFSGTMATPATFAFYRDMAVPANVAVGDKLELCVEVESDATVGIISPTAMLRMITALGTDDPRGHSAENPPGPEVAWKGMIRAPEYTVPAAPTTVRARLSVAFASGTNIPVSGNIRFRACSIRKVQ